MNQESYERWITTAAKAKLEDKDIDTLLDDFAHVLSYIEGLQDPLESYSNLIMAVGLFNRAVSLRLPKLPDVQKKLRGAINHLQSTVRNIANKLSNVTGYSVGIGFPFGISASISFHL